MIRTILASAAVLALTATAAPHAASAQSRIDGTYRDQDGYVQIVVAPCSANAAARCGTITRILRMKEGETNRDRYNDDPALRNRPITGIRLLQNMTWRDGAWRGQVYNPEDGGTYRAVVRPGRGGALSVQGCLSIVCRTVTWPAA
ncbi:DUF2147 domain-containing protein [Erythrobacter arachoides]|uniref:DUF2147 domain-containing protein n=1 Tax=Aurantiacibacter arachoides TaxID=1850444 RepID=A0A844ZVE3_9SPHN|nr:DUF2147 domain-containing protein [Aurantiacibacter arachoides]MXO92271.1 DUF2147 domain-containing protein [Aurantiacibacter arachoides]GGD58396.1 hypothetical protein GCM10011411_18190 [Aurantiacibacter arachoides]